MFEWLSNNVGLALVILSVFGLVGGSFSAEGLTFKLNTAKGRVNVFLMVIGSAGLVMLLIEFLLFYF
jgi:hypothetical protein